MYFFSHLINVRCVIFDLICVHYDTHKTILIFSKRRRNIIIARCLITVKLVDKNVTWIFIPYEVKEEMR